MIEKYIWDTACSVYKYLIKNCRESQTLFEKAEAKSE
jgi:hypothetical protein